MRPLDDLVAQFEACTLPREEWTHAAHLCVALKLFHTSGRDEAQTLERIRAGIKRYNAAMGVVDGPMSGYHETLTVFWVKWVGAFSRSHEAVAEEMLPRLLEELSDVRMPLRYYSKRVLMNPTARARFVEPDLAPLEF